MASPEGSRAPRRARSRVSDRSKSWLTCERLEDRVVPTGVLSTRFETPAGLLGAAVEPGTNGAPHYMAGDTRVDLTPRTETVAVRVGGGDPQAVLARLTGAGGALAGYAVAEQVTPGVYVLEGPAGLGWHGVTTLTSDVLWATPAYELVGADREVLIIDEVVVALKGGANPANVFTEGVVGYTRLLGTPDQYVVTLTGAGATALDYADAIAADPRVAWAAPNTYRGMEKAFTPDDPRFANQWHLNNTGANSGQLGAVAGADVNASAAWDISTGEGIVIAVLDDGVQTSHPDLAANIFENPGETPGDGIDNDGNGFVDDVNGWSFVNIFTGGSPTIPTPPAGNQHGTSVAGIAASVGNNSLGGTGVAFNAKILPAQMFNGPSFVGDAGAAAAIYYAAGRTADGLGTWDAADIINCSWGGGAPSPAITAAITWAVTQGRGGLGVPVFIASGNGGTSSISYPASLSQILPGVMAVGASNDQDIRSGYSQYGTGMDFVTPSSDGGRNLGTTTTDRTGTLGYNPAGDYTNNLGSTGFSGTSSASPLAAGIGALVLAADPTLTAAGLQALLRATADKIGGVTYNANGFHLEYGYGRLNALRALQQTGLIVSTTSPAVGSVVTTPPANYVVTFSRALNETTLQASDFTVNGVPATGVTYNAALKQATFTFATNPVTAEGTQTMAMAAGAVVSTAGESLQGFSGTFQLDAVPLVVTGTSPVSGSTVVIDAGSTVVRVTFNEPVTPGSVAAADFGVSAGVVSGVALVPGNQAVDVTIGGLTAEGPLTLTVAANAFTDGNGGSNPAGFIATFERDFVTRPFPTPLTASAPAGSRVYTGAPSAGLVNAVGDTDAFTLNLDPGQSLQVVVRPVGAPALRARVELFAPSGASLGSAEAAAAGQLVSLQVPVGAGGTYRIEVTGVAGTGNYTVETVLNAVREAETLLGTSNDTPAGAQNLNPGFTAESTALASVSRAAVLGAAAAAPDYYSFTASAGQTITAALAGLAAGNVDVQLIAPDGTTVLAAGAAVGTNLNEAIQSFALPANGTYFLRVTGDAGATYNLVVTRGAAVDAERNDTPGTAQPLGGSRGVLGAVTSGGYEAAVVPFGFTDISATGTTVFRSVDEGTTPSLPIGFNFRFYGTTYSALFVSTNGLITFGSANQSFGNGSLGTTVAPTQATIAALWDDLYVFNPGNTATVKTQLVGSPGSRQFIVQWDQINYNPHDLADTITFQAILSEGSNTIRLNYLDLTSGAVPGNEGASATVGVKGFGALTPQFLDVAVAGPNEFVGTGKSTLISAVTPEDWYAVTLAAGETALRVETNTPGDGPGQFGNAFNPRVEVYNAAGTTLLAAGLPLADGRNEGVTVQGLTPGGTYLIRVTGEGGTTGEYFVGATALRTPAITSRVDDSVPGNSGPEGSFAGLKPVVNGWANVTGAGYQNDYTRWTHNPAKQGPTNFASWNVRVTPAPVTGAFELFATWVPRAGNATNATYQIREGATVRGTVVVDQTRQPNDALLFGTTLAESLGTFTKLNPATKFFNVRLVTAGANGDLVADGVFDPPAAAAVMVKSPATNPARVRPAGTALPPAGDTSVLRSVARHEMVPVLAELPADLPALRPAAPAGTTLAFLPVDTDADPTTGPDDKLTLDLA